MVRGDVYWCALNPTKGSEIRKTRPVVVVSPNEIIDSLNTVVVVPVTSKGYAAPFRVSCVLEGKKGLMLVDQLRAVDKTRLGEKVGTLSAKELQSLLHVLQDFFS